MLHITKRDLGYLIVIFLLVNTISLRGCRDNQIEEKPEYNYTTKIDSINKSYIEYLKSVIEINMKLQNYKNTPPSRVIIYNTPNPKSTVIEKVPDSILVIIDSLEQRIAISDKYIKNFPKSSKLLTMNLVKDSLHIGLLNIDGSSTLQKYPIYLDKYKYYWFENKLKHKKLKFYKNSKHYSPNGLYANAQYKVIDKKYMIGLNYDYQYKRIKFTTEANVSIEESPTLDFRVTVKYRLFK